MSVEVASRFRQALSRTVLGSSLAGDGLLVRMRRATIALLAVVAAVGLGLIAFVSQVGWPTVFSGPIPAGPEPGVVRNDPIAAPRLFASQPGTRVQGVVRRAAGTLREGAGAGAPSVLSGSEVGSSHQAEAPPVEPAPPAPAPPQQAEVPDAAPEPAPMPVSSPDRARSPEVEETRAVRASKADRPPGKPRGKRGRAPKAEPPPPQMEEDSDDYDQGEDDSAPEKDDRGPGRDGRGKPDWAGH
ncbi:MAG TPA: hypothetical protein VFW48_00545 [Solirubrobacterales bacterium]|nr:hypothetical protein [Solirubrobacterales bacterium]